MAHRIRPMVVVPIYPIMTDARTVDNIHQHKNRNMLFPGPRQRGAGEGICRYAHGRRLRNRSSARHTYHGGAYGVCRGTVFPRRPAALTRCHTIAQSGECHRLSRNDKHGQHDPCSRCYVNSCTTTIMPQYGLQLSYSVPFTCSFSDFSRGWELAENPTVREKYLGRGFIFHRKKFD